MAADVDVVVFDVGDTIGKAGIMPQHGHRLNESLARFVLGVGLAGKYELNGPFLVVAKSSEPIEVAHDHRGALVGGKAAAEADGKYVGIENIAGSFDGVVAFAAAAGLAADAAANEREQQVFQRVVRFPQLARIDVVDVLPDFGLAHAENPLRGKVPVVELQHLLGEPAWNVYAVGDVADGNFFFDSPRPERGPHATRDMAVKLADRVGAAGDFQADDGHGERFVVVLRLDAAEAHQLLVADAELVAQGAQVLFDKAAVKAIVAGGNWRVCREDGLAGNFAQGVVESHAVVVHPLADNFQRAERAVPFVEMINAGCDAQRPERLDAADAEYQFLPDTGSLVAAI